MPGTVIVENTEEDKTSNIAAHRQDMVGNFWLNSRRRRLAVYDRIYACIVLALPLGILLFSFRFGWVPVDYRSPQWQLNPFFYHTHLPSDLPLSLFVWEPTPVDHVAVQSMNGSITLQNSAGLPQILPQVAKNQADKYQVDMEVQDISRSMAIERQAIQRQSSTAQAPDPLADRYWPFGGRDDPAKRIYQHLQAEYWQGAAIVIVLSATLIWFPRGLAVCSLLVCLSIFNVNLGALAINAWPNSLSLLCAYLAVLYFSGKIWIRLFYLQVQLLFNRENVQKKWPVKDRRDFWIKWWRIPDFHPLPIQMTAIEDLRTLTLPNQTHKLHTANLVALQGGWGSGKSTVLEIYRSEAWARGQVATIYVNAWERESDENREFSIYSELANSVDLLWPWGWMVVPVVHLTVQRLMPQLHVTFSSAFARNSHLKVETDQNGAISPPIYWSSRLSWLVKAASRRFKRVVVIVDEIDRCKPIAAQQFVTLLRRFLAVDNVSVITAYSPGQFRYKVFNPLFCKVPDLLSTAEGLLWETWENYKEFQEKMQEQLRADSVSIDASQSAINSYKTDLFSEKTADKTRLSYHSVVEAAQYQIHYGYMKMDRFVRNRFIHALEEKYIYDDLVFMKACDKTTFLQMLEEDERAFKTVKAAVIGLIQTQPRDVDINKWKFADGDQSWMKYNVSFCEEKAPSSFEELAGDVWDACNADMRHDEWPPSLRQLHGAMGEYFSSKRSTIADQKNISAENLLAYVLINALRHATKRTRLNGVIGKNNVFAKTNN